MTKLSPFLRRLVAFAACLLGVVAATRAADAPKKTFAIAAGDAETTLRHFSQQAGVQFIFDSDKVSGVRTAELRGEYAPREALDRMLSGTGLVAVQNEKTGALTLTEKADPRKNAPRAAPTAGDRPVEGSSADLGGGVVQGRVLNLTTGNFLNNARVQVVGTRLETFTNENGEYRLVNLPAGEVRLAASFTGLAERTITVAVTPGAVERRDFELAIIGAAPVTEGALVRMEAMTVEERELSGQAIALHERRNAPNIKNVVAIDVDTGEGNIGEFLKYVPGIGIDQSPQNPQFVSIRGMPASGTIVTTNGMEMASNSYTSGRETDFGVAATGNIDRIEVTKVPTPDMPANAVGGMINMVTKSGFSRKTPLFSYNLYGTFTNIDGMRGPWNLFEKSHGPDSRSDVYRIRPSLNLSYLRPFNQSLAVAVSFSTSDRYNDWDYRRPIWDKIALKLNSNSMNALVIGEGKLLGAATVDWKLNQDNTVSFGASHSLQKIYTRQNVVTSTFGAGSTGGPTFAYGAATGVSSVVMDPIWTNQNKSLDLFTLTHRFNGAKWKADTSLSYSKVQTKFTDMEDGFFTRAASTSITNLVIRNDRIDDVFARRTPIVTAVNRTGQPVDIHDIRNYTLTTASSGESNIRNQGRRAAFNVSRELDLPVAVTLKSGVLFNRIRNSTVAGTKSWTFTPPGGAAARLIGNYDLVADKFSAQNHFTDANGDDVPVKWLSLAKLKNLYDAHPDWFVTNPASTYIAAVNATKLIEETITAAYLRSDVKLFENRLWIVGGVRLEQTQDEGWGPLNDIRNVYVKDANGNIVRNANGTPVRITTDTLAAAKLQYTQYGTHMKKRYDGFYPSLNTSFWFTRNFVARAAYARTIGRPNFPEILPGVTATDPDAPAGSRTVTVVNTALRPWTSNNYDLSLEMYEMKGAVASLSLFRKDVTDFFGSTRVAATRELLADLDLDDEYLGYDIITKQNVGRANITGVEAGYRQALEPLVRWARGVQVFMNMTNMALGGAQKDNFTNFNPRSIQQGITFTNRKINAKVSYNYTWFRRRLPAAAGATIRPDSYNTYVPQTKVDVSLAYMWSKRYTFYVDVRNLNGSPQRSGTFSADTPEYARLDQFQYAGAAFTFGVRGDF